MLLPIKFYMPRIFGFLRHYEKEYIRREADCWTEFQIENEAWNNPPRELYGVCP